MLCIQRFARCEIDVVSYFEFKIKLISFQKQENPVLELATYCFTEFNQKHTYVNSLNYCSI